MFATDAAPKPAKAPLSRGRLTARACLLVFLGTWCGTVDSGCAFTDVTVTPLRSPRLAAGARRGQGRQVVLVRPFRDQRSDSGRCGMKKNGYNMDTANVLCRVEPETMLADMLADELDAAGFRVLRDPRRATPSTIIISGALKQTFVEPKLSFFLGFCEADIALTLTAKTASGLRAERSIYVKSEDPFFFDQEWSTQLAFDSGVRQTLAIAVGSIMNLMEQFPEASLQGPAPEQGTTTTEPGGR